MRSGWIGSTIKANFHHIGACLLALIVVAVTMVKLKIDQSKNFLPKRASEISHNNDASYYEAGLISPLSNDLAQLADILAERSLSAIEMEKLISYDDQAIDTLIKKLDEFDEEGKARVSDLLSHLYTQIGDPRIPSALATLLLEKGTVTFKNKVLRYLEGMNSNVVVPALEKVVMHYHKRQRIGQLDSDEVLILQRAEKILAGVKR